MSSTTATLKETTFTSFTPDQGKLYAQHRANYDPSVYQHVIDHHRSTGGQFTSVLDVGCGPGLATFSLAPHFTTATGIDPGESMLAPARSSNPSPSSIHFHLAPAENMSPISTASVDLITAANAAHWFDMGGFWSEAHRVLKSHGTVALWTTSEPLVHPSVPNAHKIQQAIWTHRETYLAPYTVEGNNLTRNGYRDLKMPWDAGVSGFDRQGLSRRVWGEDERFTVRQDSYDMPQFEMALGTGSPVVRWREANPDKVGTEEDVVRVLRREIESLLREAGVERPEEMVFKGRVPGVVLMLKKTA